MKNISSHQAILILGSGPLHEIPIEELSLQFKEVVLVDIVHLKATKKKVAHLKNVHFIEHDISELEHDLMDKKRLMIQVPSRFLDREWGMVISANILSQIPLHLNSYSKKIYLTFLLKMKSNTICKWHK